MLRELHISGLGVIRDLDLELTEGLTVLTGETGTGKTMLTVGLALAGGARGGAHLVGPGATAARVQARFEVPDGWVSNPVGSDDVSVDWIEDGEVILARSVGTDGKSSARIGGQLTTASALSNVSARLIEIHGQHGSLRLLDPSTQTAFLDRYAGAPHLAAVAAYAESYQRATAARRALRRLEDDARDRERELDLLRYQVEEIRSVAPELGETDALRSEEHRLAHGERLLELAAAAEEILAAEGGVAEGSASVVRGLGSIVELDAAAAGLAARAEALAAEAAELGRDLRAYREGLALDPARLASIRERIGELKGLQRKYGPGDAEVLAFLDEAAARILSLSGADERLEELRAEVEALAPAVTALAEQVTAGRMGARTALADALGEEIQDLGMPGAAIQVALGSLPEPGPSGAERVELRFRGGPGQPWLTFAKAASGGELSRVMLACRSVLADLDDVPTLVFDEVDAGIGGQAGLAVGRRLARLALTRQVVVVTHLPQIACFADRHVRVRKDEGVAQLEVLEDRERIPELSRMLAGLEASEHGASHAEELLAEAARSRQAVS
ncbi:MAG TPA: DNA repair protein RecN [Actinomycetota bacterium]|nr:DNA repair protein RecN [Actinomycetota bacterium]